MITKECREKDCAWCTADNACSCACHDEIDIFGGPVNGEDEEEKEIDTEEELS